MAGIEHHGCESAACFSDAGDAQGFAGGQRKEEKQEKGGEREIAALIHVEAGGQRMDIRSGGDKMKR